MKHQITNISMRQLQVILLSTLLLTLIYGEVITYILHSASWDKSNGLTRSKEEFKQWQKLQLLIRDSPIIAPKVSIDNIRYLVISNPSLENEFVSSFSTFDRLRLWDSDRYLRKVFGMAVREYQPDVVVILGDIMKDGAQQSQEEFEISALRFKTIFHSQIPTVVVPGDADVIDEVKVAIDKEGHDLTALRRFEEYFQHKINQYYQFHHFTFATIDSLSLYGHAQLRDNTWPTMQFLSNAHVRMASISTKTVHSEPIPSLMFCHYPVYALEGHIKRSIINELKPRYIFSSRNHAKSSKTSHQYPSGSMEITVPSISSTSTGFFESNGFVLAHLTEQGAYVTICTTPSRNLVILAYGIQVLALGCIFFYNLYQGLFMKEKAELPRSILNYSSGINNYNDVHTSNGSGSGSGSHNNNNNNNSYGYQSRARPSLIKTESFSMRLLSWASSLLPSKSKSRVLQD